MRQQTDKKGKRRLNQPIDAEVHRRVKVWAVKNDLQMAEALEAVLAAGLEVLEVKEWKPAEP